MNLLRLSFLFKSCGLWTPSCDSVPHNSWHPVTTTQHLSWKNCTGFAFQNVLSHLYVFQCYKWFWFCLPLNCCMATLRLVHYALLLTPACWKSNNTNTRLMAFAPSLALDPTFGIHSHKTLALLNPVIF